MTQTTTYRATERIESAMEHRPTTRSTLARWVRALTGVQIPHRAVCRGHAAPFDLFARQVLERPPLALWHGPRGSGKSFLSAIDTHLASRFNVRHGTRILGGSLAQSEQTYGAIREAIQDGCGPKKWSDFHAGFRFLKNEIEYVNGSHVSILAASSTSVRGPHVPSLKLDEVDEIEPDIRESAMGMAMEIRGCKPSVLMTSTWHRVDGPMSELIDRGRAGGFPVDTYASSRSWTLSRRTERPTPRELPRQVAPAELVSFRPRFSSYRNAEGEAIRGSLHN